MQVKIKNVIDPNKVAYFLAGRIVSVIRQEDNSYLVNNPDPGEPKELWVWIIDTESLEEDN